MDAEAQGEFARLAKQAGAIVSEVVDISGNSTVETAPASDRQLLDVARRAIDVTSQMVAKALEAWERSEELGSGEVPAGTKRVHPNLVIMAKAVKNGVGQLVSTARDVVYNPKDRFSQQLVTLSARTVVQDIAHFYQATKTDYVPPPAAAAGAGSAQTKGEAQLAQRVKSIALSTTGSDSLAESVVAKEESKPADDDEDDDDDESSSDESDDDMDEPSRPPPQAAVVKKTPSSSASPKMSPTSPATSPRVGAASATSKRHPRRDENKEGYLRKAAKKGPAHGWRTRWFVLQREIITYYDSYLTRTMHEDKPLGFIPLKDVMTIEAGEGADYDTGKKFSIRLTTTYRTFFFHAETKQDLDDWLELFVSRVGPGKVNSVVPLNLDAADKALKPSKKKDELRLRSGSTERGDANMVRQGQIRKQVGRFKTWKPRWVVLCEDQLLCYKEKMDADWSKSLPFVNCVVEREDSRIGVRHSFSVRPHSGQPDARTHYFHCETEDEAVAWFEAIKNCVNQVTDQQRNKNVPPTLRIYFENGTYKSFPTTFTSTVKETCMRIAQKVGIDDSHEYGLFRYDVDTGDEVTLDPLDIPFMLTREWEKNKAVQGQSRLLFKLLGKQGSSRKPKTMHAGAIRTGWLLKRGHVSRRLKWKRRFVVLAPRVLSCYKDEVDTSPRTVISLERATVERLGTDPDKETARDCFILITEDKQTYCFANSDESDDLGLWIQSIQEQLKSCEDVTVQTALEQWEREKELLLAAGRD